MTYVGYETFTTQLENMLLRQAGQYEAALAAQRDRAPYPGEIEALETRKSFTVNALTIRPSDDGEWFPDRLADLPAWSASLLKRVPAKYRASATLEVTGSEYDTSLEVTYRRTETDKEWRARRADVMRRQALAVARKEEADRQEFERLQAKYAHNAHHAGGESGTPSPVSQDVV